MPFWRRILFYSTLKGSEKKLNKLPTVTSHDLATITYFFATAVAGEVERASPWVHTNYTDLVQFSTRQFDTIRQFSLPAEQPSEVVPGENNAFSGAQLSIWYGQVVNAVPRVNRNGSRLAQGRVGLF